MTKLSVIIPVYNVDRYLAKCIDSVLAQDIADMEVLLVDDGSTDNSGRICDAYAAQDVRIIVIHKANAGVSAARNTAIQKARGRYILCVDADDYMQPDTIGRFIGKMEEEQLDMLRFNYRFVDEAGSEAHPYKNPKAFISYEDKICDGITFLNERLGFGCYLWQFIVRAAFFKQHLLQKGRLFAEDTLWCTQAISNMQRCTSVDIKAYNYLVRETSITNTHDLTKKRHVLEDQMTLIHELKCHSLRYRIDSPVSWYDCMIARTTLAALNNVIHYFYYERASYIQQLKDMDIFPLSYTNSTSVLKRKLQLINISPALYCWLMHIKK